METPELMMKIACLGPATGFDWGREEHQLDCISPIIDIK